MNVILHVAEREDKTAVLGGLQLHWIIGSSIAVNDFFLNTNMDVEFSLVHGYVSMAQYSTLGDARGTSGAASRISGCCEVMSTQSSVQNGCTSGSYISE